MSYTMAVPPQANSPAVTSSDKDDTVPPLTFSVLTKDADKQDALKLVTDSVAQQRQIASFAVIFHPVCFAGLIVGCAAVYRQNSHRDLGSLLMMVCGLIIAYLAAVRMLTANYIRLAESLKWKQWIADPEGREDHVLAARYGDEIIASAVLRIVPPPTSAKKARSSSVKGGSGVIRAWTTKYRYRNKGIGGDMLRLAILTTRSKCGDDAQVSFDANHANSARPPHEMFNRPFIRREERATLALEHAIDACNRGDSSFQAA